MDPHWIENGRIAVPVAVQEKTSEGTIFGDGFFEVPIGSPDWDENAAIAVGVPTSRDALERLEDLLRAGRGDNPLGKAADKYRRDGEGRFAETPGGEGSGSHSLSNPSRYEAPGLGGGAAASPGERPSQVVPAEIEDKKLAKKPASPAALSAAFAPWRESLTDAEKSSLAGYQNATFLSINSKLRGAYATADRSEGYDDFELEHLARQDKYIENIDSALAKAFMPETVTVMRGMTWADFRGYDGEQLGPPRPDFEVGEVFEDRGFSSTTTNKKISDAFVKGKGLAGRKEDKAKERFLFNIEVPEGARAAFLGDDLLGEDTTFAGGMASQDEVLLPRNAAFEVTGKSIMDPNDPLAYGGKKKPVTTVYDVRLIQS